MKNITKSIFALALAILLVFPLFKFFSVLPISDTGANFKLTLLCEEHPEIECQEIFDYCEESIKNRRDCYIIK